MLKRAFVPLSVLCLSLTIGVPSPAALIGVTGGLSSAGTAPAIIGAPANVLDDDVVNSGMQGFNEAQGVTTTVAHTIDGGGTIPIGTVVNSHMIFLNNRGDTRLSHADVDWTFDGPVLGVMSDSPGFLEAASTPELGSPLTNYTVTFPGSGDAAPFNARGLESGSIDNYSMVNAFTLRVSMVVTEPGDWIRVVTAPATVPEPASLFAFGGLFGVTALGYLWRRKRTRG